MLTVEIKGHIPVNNVIVDALDYLMCQGYIEAICKNSNRYTPAQMRTALAPLRQEICHIKEASRVAVEAINKPRSKV